jgi:hypothetical protein
MKKIFTLFFVMCMIHASKAQEAYSFNLDEAIQYALKNNYTVRNASLDIDAGKPHPMDFPR